VSDFQVKVGGDFSELLRGFQQLETRAKTAGDNVGKGIGDGIQGFSSKSLAALNQELNRLQQRQLKVAVDSSAFEKAGAQIKEVQALISAVQRQQVLIQVDDRSVTALQTKLADLQSRQVKVDVDSQEFIELQRQINAAEKELQEISQRKVLIDADANSFLAVTAKLRNELNGLQERQLKIDVDSQEFVALGKEIDRVEGELQALERKRTAVTIDASSIEALQAKLTDLQTRQTKVSVDSQEFADLQVQINNVQRELLEVEQKKILINVDGNSITALTTKLKSELNELEQRRVTIDVDSQEFVEVSQQIDRVEGELQALERKKLLINADPSSIIALRSRLGELQGELEKTQIGSQRFRELQSAIQDTERELAKAGQAADGFNLIDGAIQGLAFSLTNTVTEAAGTALNAIGSLVTGFAALDTEIRQAAAAAGEAGGYDKIARAIDQVGIEAAGTQQEVAQLATELVRGGMTVDQMNASLGAIVRGAEATGTGFAQMGSVVSASLKGFGLQASDATRVVDALVTGANASAASVDGMGIAFKYAAPVARILGVSVEELGIAIGLLTNAGIDASEAGVTLRNGLSKLASAAPSAGDSVGQLTGQAKMAAETMAQLGINIFETDGTLQPMETTLLKLKGAFDKLEPASKIRLAANLFGGEDDGTKWLALLNQSEEEIRRMAASMANTKGATDTARDAMQGFQMEVTQLTGTLDSIGKTLGSVAAAGLTPLVGLANQLVGVIAGLPAPVKAAASALVLMTGAATAATAAVVIFQRAMTVTAVQIAAAEIKMLAGTMATTLVGGVKAAVAVIPGLITQLSLIGSLGVGTVLSAIATTLKTTLVTGFTAASASVLQFTTYLQSASFASFIAGAKGAVLALAPLALALGAAIALFKTWEFVLGGQAAASKEFEDSNKAISEALTKLGVDLDTTAEKARQARGGFLGLGEVFRNAREGWTLLRLVDETEKLEEGFNEVFNSAVTFVNELKRSGEVTDEQRKKAQEYIAELQKVAEAYRAQAERAKLLATEQARLGNADLAKFYESQARSLVSNAKALDNLRGATEKQIGVQSASTDATGKNTAATDQNAEAQDRVKQAIQARAEAEAQLNKIIAEAPVRNLEAQLSVGQQLVGLSKALADQEQSRFAVVKAGLEFELSKAQERGASESQIGEIKSRIQEQDRQSLEARYQALIQQQQLEAKLLELSQQKARTEADLSVFEARKALLQAEVELKKLSADASTEERAKAEAIVELQRAALGVNEERLGVLAQTQPLERQIAAATAETARNGLQEQAAQAGFNIELDGSVTKTAALAAETSKVKQAAEARKRVEQEIGEVIKQSSLRLATEQLSVAEKLVSLSRALAAEEQSRFDLVRSNLEYELQKAEERGASESEIGSIKERIQKVDRAAAEARYKALLQQQQLESKMLEIAQRKQVLEANVEFRKQQLALLEAQKKLQEAIAAGDQGAIALARSQVGLQQLMLGVRGEQLGLLAQTQPLEAQILAAQQSAAINAERARAAQNGYQLAAAQSAVNLGNVASIAGGLNNIAAGYAQNLGAAATQAGQLEGAVSDAQSPADGIADAFTTTGDRAPAAAQGARDFAAWLSSAKTFAERIAGLSLDTQMATVAQRTAAAAGAAKVFYDWLERASRLPGSRWTGGPVEAGEQYRVNELGQEALLSGGRLSLINAAPNSIWRAPTNGTVIPAGITSRLQDQGALPSRPGTTPIMTSGSSNAALAVEVGKLRQEVGELARKQWNVNVAMKTGPTGSQVIRQMMR
jgi:TP901 family phage tail tape measure protein